MGFIRRPGNYHIPGDTFDEQNNFFTIDPRSSFVTADLSLLQAPSPGPVVSDVVFIDSSVPDIQDLLNGLKPGEKAFVIDAGSDGLDQIAGILKSEHLGNLSGIQIVAHGAAGELELGSTTLNDSDLSDHASALATIGNALASGGDLSLYACDTAQGASGQQFIADLSHLAGVNVAAATHDIGQTPDGENWTLDATTGMAAAPATPFTAEALAHFEGTLTTGVFRVPSENPGANGFNDPVVATLGNGDIAIAFDDNDGQGGNGTIEADVFDQNGNRIGSEFQGQVPNTQNALAVDGPSSNTFWVLDNVLSQTTGFINTITAQEMTVSGNTVTPGSAINIVSNANADMQDETVVKLSNGDYVVAWGQSDYNGSFAITGGETKVEIFDSNFNALSSAISVSTSGTNSSFPFNFDVFASTNGTTVDVTWIANNGSNDPEYGVSFGVASNGASLTGLTTPVDLTAALPTGAESSPQTELANGNILVLYTDAEGTGNLDGEIFSPGFTSPQTPFTIADSVSGFEPLEAHASLFPSGAYIVTYERGLTSTQEEIYARIYNSDNTPLTNEFLVTIPTANVLNFNPTVAVANGTGGIALTWLTTTNHGAQDADARIFSDVGPISNGAGSKLTDIFDNTVPASGTAISSLITGGQYDSILGHPFAGVAIVGNAATAAQGTWEYSTNSGSTWNNISTTVSDTNATIIGPNDQVRFVPAANFSGAPGSLTTLVWDGQDGFTVDTTGNDISQSIFDTSDVTQTTETFTGAFAGTSVAFSTNIIGLNEAETGVVLAGATLSKSTAGTGVLGDATNLDGHTLTVTLVRGSSGNVGHSVTGTYGSLTLNSDGTYSYAANNAAAIAAITGSHPIDTFNYTVSDEQGVTANATLTITVDRAPVATADTNLAKVNGPAVTGNVVTNDTDQDSDTLTVTAISDSSHGSGTVGSNLLGQYGTLKLNANGSYTYTANTSISAPTGSHATDVFTYTESDGFTGTASSTLTVTLDRVPVAVADTNAVVVGGSAATGNVTTNDTNLDGDTLTITGFTDGSAGTVGTLFHGTYGDLTLNSDGSYTYALGATVGEQTALANAATGSHPTEVITYTESDGIGDTTSSTLTISIDRLPVAVADTKTVVAGTTGTGNVITNDSDADGDTLTVSGFADGASGTVGTVFHGTYGDLTLNANGSYSYTAGATVGEQTALANAATGSHATEVVTYTESDGNGGVASSTLTITLDRLPVTVADTNADVAGSTATGNVLTNDSDADGDTLTVSGFTDGASGTVGTVFHGTYGDLTLNADGSYTYSAGATVGEQTALANATTGSHATEVVTYTDSDGFGGTASSTLTITLDRLPVAVADTNTDVAGATATGNVLTNDSDPDGDTLTVTGFTDGTSGTVGTVFHGTYGDLTLNADGSYSYAAGANVGEQTALANATTGSHATEVVTYTESDGHGGTASSTLTITLDRLPVAVADTNSTVAEGSAATGNVLTNDSDADGDTLTVTGFTDGSSGTLGTVFHGTYGDLTLNSSGTYSYTSGATVGEQTAIANAATGSHPTEIVTYTESDGHGGTASTTLSISVDRAPAITLNVPSETYTALTPAEALQGGASVTDPDGNDAIASATVTLTGGYAGDGDLLSYNGNVGTVTLTDGSQYSVVYAGAGSGSETLTISTTSGTGTQADYDQLINGVVFSSTATDPTNAGANATRSASFQVTDAGGATSAAAGPETINVQLAPVITSVTATTTGGATDLDVNKVVTITAHFSSVVDVTGMPELQLNDSEFATYSGGTGSNALTFSYIVQSGDNTADLQVQSLLLNGGTIQGNGKDAVLTNAPTDLHLQVDTTAPTVSVAGNHTSLLAGQTATVTFTFSEAVASFALGDTSVTGGALSNLVHVGLNGSNQDIYTATFTPSVTNTEAGSVQVNAASYADLAGNNGAASNTLSFTGDTLAPTVSIAADHTALLAGHTATVTFTFSESVPGFVLGDTSVSGGSLSNLIHVGLNGSNQDIYTATFTPAATNSEAGSVQVTSASYTDAAGNAGSASNTIAFTGDTLAPTVSIAANHTALLAGQTATMTFTFSEAVASFTLGDTSVTGGSLSNLVHVGLNGSNQDIYTATFTPSAVNSEAGSVQVTSASYTDVAGNPGSASNTVDFTGDTLAPTVSVAANHTTLLAGQTATVTFTFSEAVSSFALADTVVSGGTLSNLVHVGLNGSNQDIYTATFTPGVTNSEAGSVQVTSASYTDLSGNAGAASNTLSFTGDTLAPTVSIAANHTALLAGQTATVTFTFSESVPGFVLADTTVSGGSLSNLVHVGLNGSNQDIYTATFTPTAANSEAGSVQVTPSSYTDAAGNPGSASNTVSFSGDTLAPTVSVAANHTTLLAGQTSTVTFTFSEAVASFVLGDTTVSGGSLSNLVHVGLNGSNQDVYTATFTPNVTNTEAGSVAVNASSYTDLAGNAGAASNTLSITGDTLAPTVAIAANHTSLLAGQTALMTFTFSEAVSNFALGDTSVSGGSLSNLVHVGLNGSHQDIYTATFTPSVTNTEVGSVEVNVASYTDLAGNVGAASNTINFTGDTLAPTATATAQPSTGTEMFGNVVKMTLSFGEAVTISGATPELTLNDGGHAIYDPTATAALHDPTKLVFDYTVGSNDSTVSTLAITGITAGTTITDLAGNPANVAAAFNGLGVLTSVVNANPDSNHVAAGQTLTTTAAQGVLANDTDTNPSDHLVVSTVEGLAGDVNQPVAGNYGTLTLHADGSYSYVASSSVVSVGVDTFYYMADDGHGQTSNSLLTIIVTPANQTYVQVPAGGSATAGFGNTTLDGSAGNATLNASATLNAHQFLIGGPGDTLNAASYGQDTFVFNSNFGHDTVNNFQPALDVIQLQATVWGGSVANIMADIQQVGANSVLTLDPNHVVTITNTQHASLTAADFHLV
ncbi:MAG TPA: Ig-like domain-containing protein [Bradyrhizobium sp.]|uniref:Ig-like domain-containing protein n=1 Tax=Bradyrhizobium sp. TaxID=376 RepID=UPI002C813AC2|nr:Ig-like domain-containing protein [Bradyrhizobium sp.]HTB02708.1 Ig-like domain-containing protein [Bradyrhizobium sp.]